MEASEIFTIVIALFINYVIVFPQFIDYMKENKVTLLFMIPMFATLFLCLVGVYYIVKILFEYYN
jgi:hypothetical protein